MERLCIVATERKLLGYVCLPYIVETDKAPIYNLIEPATVDMAKRGRFSFTEEELVIVKKLNDLTDQNLCKKFAPKNSIKQFYEKTDQALVDKFIIPFIDKTIASVMPAIVENDILFFHKKAGYNNLYETDIVKTNKRASRPKCFFTIDENNILRYSLSITDKVDNNIIEKQLINKKAAEIMHNPAALIIDNVLYWFENIDSKKFRPFYQKKLIAVQEESVDMYMHSFVRKCIMDYFVVAKGFQIKKKDDECKAILVVEPSVFGHVFMLYFQYGKERYLYGEDKKNVELQKVDGQYVFYVGNRHLAHEKKASNILIDLGLVDSQGGTFIIENEDGQNSIENHVEWINKNRDTLDKYGIRTEIKDTVEYYEGHVSLNINIDEGNDWFDIAANVVLDGYVIPFIKLKNNILHKNREYKLPNGQIFIIPIEWFAEWGDVMQFSTTENEKMRVSSMHKALMPRDYIECTGEDDGQMFSLSSTERQGEINATLRPYQEDGFRWLNTLYENKKGGILADDMGLGKTIQAISLLCHIYATADKRDGEKEDLFGTYNDSTIGASLVVLPVSLVHNWNNEIAKFAPHLKVYNYTGRNRIKSNEIGKILRHYHVVLITYGLLRNDIAYLSKYNFGYIILDESQNIKNPSSIVYKAVSEIKADHFLTISGTPIENSLNDLWAQMNIVNKGLLGSASFFKSYFVHPIEHNNDEVKQEKLKRLISPFILRRTKDMVAKDLPPITEQTIFCEMTQEQSEIYEMEKSGCRNELLHLTDNSLQTETFMALKALTRLRLIANHPSLTIDDYEGGSGKTDQIIEQIKSITEERHKMLVFSSFVRDLELIRSELQKLNIKHCMLTGQTHDRQSVINEFQNDENIRVFLISLKAGGVGLNLTQADYVLMLNPWWNPQAEKQAIDRAHRIGQTKHVFVYRFITKDTIEEKIAALQEKKRQLAGTFITSDNPLTGLSAEEIKALITE